MDERETERGREGGREGERDIKAMWFGGLIRKASQKPHVTSECRRRKQVRERLVNPAMNHCVIQIVLRTHKVSPTGQG